LNLGGSAGAIVWHNNAGIGPAIIQEPLTGIIIQFIGIYDHCRLVLLMAGDGWVGMSVTNKVQSTYGFGGVAYKGFI
jgi:hypothetical protein